MTFETINQEILLEKLNHYEIGSKENNWFHSFITNRKQYVSINGFYSQTKLSLNESKTKLLIFRLRIKLNVTVTNIKLNNFILIPEKTVTYLGILVKILNRANCFLSKPRYIVSKIL